MDQHPRDQSGHRYRRLASGNLAGAGRITVELNTAARADPASITASANMSLASASAWIMPSRPTIPAPIRPPRTPAKLSVMGSDKSDGPHIITMNEPLTVQGLTFYQAGFSNEDGVGRLDAFRPLRSGLDSQIHRLRLDCRRHFHHVLHEGLFPESAATQAGSAAHGGGGNGLAGIIHRGERRGRRE
jgi:hypothetical protein